MKRFALLACGWLLATVLSAQQLDPVKWTYTVKETSATEAELLFTAKLDAGWHMYSQYTDPMGPLPVAFEFVESGDYQRLGKVLEPKPHEEMDDVFQCVVKSFSGTVVFRQKVKRLSERDFTVKGVLSY
ncbi:MAG: thiol:disulfide interchange protein, partial [Bacteroidales bacterium]|nr:thiol:disulfide interchange protein [Bacteroidales bacterium]